MAEVKSKFPHYVKVKYFIDNYGTGQMADNRAVGEFMEIEQREVISTLRQELQWITLEKFDPKTLDQLVGKKRIIKHSSYQQWAKYMLIWMSEYKG